MKTSVAIRWVEILLEKHAPHLVAAGWTVELVTRPIRRYGQTIYSDKTITLSEKFVVRNDVKAIEEVGKHEIAHALVGPGHGHGFIWRVQAIQLGVQPTACIRNVVAPPSKYRAICNGCQYIYSMNRFPRRERWCRKCGRIRGRLVWEVNLTEKSDVSG